jgi:membrane-bound lytic murein transglycosylase A
MLALTVICTACGGPIREAGSPPLLRHSAIAKTAAQLGLRSGPPVTALSLSEADAAAALHSFRESCPRVTTRADTSGLTQPGDWQAVCVVLATSPYTPAARFFETHFETLQVGDGHAFATGYYEPEIAGARTHLAGYDTPVYAVPPDLVRARPDDAAPLPTGLMPLGRYDHDGRFLPYHDRAEIEDGALAGSGLELAWVRDPVEFFFLQVQGSGRLRLPDGDVMQIGYAAQNGWTYTAIGAVMRQRGLIGGGLGQYPGSMQGIMQYIRAHPEEGRALMRENRSCVFFRELKGEGPLGSLGVPVRAKSSVAADPSFVPLGAPVWLDLDRSEADGLWIAQDTGGAIKGANRFDTFWGVGDDARRIAGSMNTTGRALILVPKGTLARLGAR